MKISWRRHKPGEDPPKDPMENPEYLDAMTWVDEMYRDRIIWADAYISLLEKEVIQLKAKCDNCDKKCCTGNDEISD